MRGGNLLPEARRWAKILESEPDTGMLRVRMGGREWAVDRAPWGSWFGKVG